MDHLLTAEARALQDTARRVASECAAPHASRVDRDAVWPAHTFEALRDAGLLGLHVPKHLGGLGQGMVGLVAVTEALARACSSSAICFGMHSVATAVITAKATLDHEERYLRPIANGEHITTLALSESGSGAHFYFPSTRVRADGEELVLDGTKQFVTNGGHADSYVVSIAGAGDDVETGDFSCVLIDGTTPDLEWLDPWHGVGMRGNAARALRLRDVRVPAANLLGAPGDQIWYVFEVVAPYFLMSMSATYLGVAQAALEYAQQHVRGRRYDHSGTSLAESQVVQVALADLWTAVQKSRLLVYSAAALGDAGDPDALPMLLASKADVADTAVRVTNEAMTLCGGAAYRENSLLAQLLRDARASHVMSPTTTLLKEWTGRSLLGLPLL